MRRCLETCGIAVPALRLSICDDLREVAFGQWEGKTLDWLERYDSERLEQRRRDPVNFRPPGGESFADVAVRLRSFVALLDFRGVTLIVAHRGTLAVLERLLRGLPLDARLTPLEPGELRILSSGELSAGQGRSGNEPSVGILEDFAPISHHRNAGTMTSE